MLKPSGMQSWNWPVGLALLVAHTHILTSVSPLSALELEGFTEPYRTIHVAADEMGIIADMRVREGDKVQVGQELARLNSDVYRALLAIAEQNMRSTGKLDAAKAELQLRRERLEKLQTLRPEGHVRQEEVDRAQTELAVADANLRAANEDVLTRKLEYQKILVQLQRRTVRAPMTGVVTALHKQTGEFVAPINPDVLTLVELDRLLANFTLMSPDAGKLRIGQKINIRFLGSDLETAGVVEFIAPVTNAESGTVQIRLQIDNANGSYRSGERCKIHLAD